MPTKQAYVLLFMLSPVLYDRARAISAETKQPLHEVQQQLAGLYCEMTTTRRIMRGPRHEN